MTGPEFEVAVRPRRGEQDVDDAVTDYEDPEHGEAGREDT